MFQLATFFALLAVWPDHGLVAERNAQIIEVTNDDLDVCVLAKGTALKQMRGVFSPSTLAELHCEDVGWMLGQQDKWFGVVLDVAYETSLSAAEKDRPLPTVAKMACSTKTGSGFWQASPA